MPALYEVLRRGTLAEVEAALAGASEEEICAVLPKQRSLLHYAVLNYDRRVHAPVIARLREWAPRYGIPDAGAVDWVSDTPLHYFIGTYGFVRVPDDDPNVHRRRWAEAVRALIAAGVDPLVETEQRPPALCVAAAYGCIGALEVLLEVPNVRRDYREDFRHSAMDYAAGWRYLWHRGYYPDEFKGPQATVKERLEAIRLLRTRGDLSHRRRNGTCYALDAAVMSAAKDPDHLPVVEALLAHGADPGAGNAIVHSVGHARVFDTLIRALGQKRLLAAQDALCKALCLREDTYYADVLWACAEPDCCTRENEAQELLLRTVVAQLCPAAVREVLARGADANARDSLGRTALSGLLDAPRRASVCSTEADEYLAVIRELTLGGADLDAMTDSGLNDYWYDDDADADVDDDENTSILFQAASLGHHALAIALLKSGARAGLGSACVRCRHLDWYNNERYARLRAAFVEAFHRTGVAVPTEAEAWLARVVLVEWPLTVDAEGLCDL